ncbi:MAG: photosystem II protein [Leptolyngbya sp. SIO1E4]|nr:photosystem II protein [Leptolyngbya sp. SIO1E4]
MAFLISIFVWLGWDMPAIAANEVNLQTSLSANSQVSTLSERLCVDTGQKIDLNNANLVAFTDCPGFYPTLAAIIVQQGPYDRVEDVLNVPDLNEQQQQLLQANLEFFMVSTPVVPLAMRMPPKPAAR